MPASKKANRKIGSLRFVKCISWQDPYQLSRLYGTAELAVKREKLKWRCRLIGGRITDWGLHGQGRSRIDNIAVTASCIEFRSQRQTPQSFLARASHRRKEHRKNREEID